MLQADRRGNFDDANRVSDGTSRSTTVKAKRRATVDASRPQRSAVANRHADQEVEGHLGTHTQRRTPISECDSERRPRGSDAHARWALCLPIPPPSPAQPDAACKLCYKQRERLYGRRMPGLGATLEECPALCATPGLDIVPGAVPARRMSWCASWRAEYTCASRLDQKRTRTARVPLWKSHIPHGPPIPLRTFTTAGRRAYEQGSTVTPTVCDRLDFVRICFYRLTVFLVET